MLTQSSFPIYGSYFVSCMVVLPIGSAEAERSFSCLRLIHLWLHSTMTIERLGNLGVLGIHGLIYRKLCSESVLYE